MTMVTSEEAKSASRSAAPSFAWTSAFRYDQRMTKGHIISPAASE